MIYEESKSIIFESLRHYNNEDVVEAGWPVNEKKNGKFSYTGTNTRITARSVWTSETERVPLCMCLFLFPATWNDRTAAAGKRIREVWLVEAYPEGVTIWQWDWMKPQQIKLRSLIIVKCWTHMIFISIITNDPLAIRYKWRGIPIVGEAKSGGLARIY